MNNQLNIFARLAVATLLILTLSLAASPVSAQVTAGLAGISGIVHDATGAVVADAQVLISNPSKGVSITLSTSGGGVFNAPSLVPAAGYAVTVDKSGFSSYSVKDIELAVGQNLNLVIPLTIATTNERIEVIGTAPLVDTTKTDVSQVIGSQQILDLPINGRRVDTFVLLTPGVTNDGNFGLLTFRGIANGNTFLLDGNDSTEQFFVENNGRTRIASQISADAVQEFQVVSANYSAEYGHASGGVINTVTRSGTNDLHGTAYWFYRNGGMIARDPYVDPRVKYDEWRLQSGASVGGAIVKDKLFFFINGEFTRRNFPLIDSYSARPSVVDSTNQVFVHFVATDNNTLLGCGNLATPAQCSAISALIPAYFGAIPRNTSQDLGFGRIDYHFSDRNIFSLSFNFMHFISPNGLQQTLVASTTGQGINNNGNNFAQVRNGKASWTSILNSNVVNNFRYGWNTDLQGDDPNNTALSSLGLLNVIVASTSAGPTLGPATFLPRVEPNETRNEVGDDLSWTKGKHIFKFGVDFGTTTDYSFFLQNLHGTYTYATADAFALDFSGNTTGAKNYKSFTQAFGNPTLNTRIIDTSFYVEDTWRATNKLTATIGGRYEYSAFSGPPGCNIAFPQTCHVHSPGTNFMPRAGLAYQLDSKTVVRAGYGMFYARMAAATLQDLYVPGNGIIAPTISLTGSNITNFGPVFPNILSAVPSKGASTLSLQFADPGLATPYSEQASLAVERELTHDLGLTVSYIWSRGVHLYSVQDLNMPTATTPFTYTIDDANKNVVGTYTTQVLMGVGNSSGVRPNTSFGGIYEDGNGVFSSYNALTVQVKKRLSHGILADLSYTWSHEIDDGQGFGQGTSNLFLSNNFSWLVNGNYALDKGNGLEDQRHRLVFSWVWEPTFTHRTDAFSRYLVNNWQVSSVMTFNSARPFSSGNISLSDTPVPGMFSNFSINGTGLGGRVPFWAPNTVLQPALIRDDLRISKIIPIKERFKLYLNFEAFNISNTWSPTTMTTAAYTEKAGVLTLTPNSFGQGSNDAYPPDGSEARRLQVSARFTF